MEKVLSQEEIDALFRRAQSRTAQGSGSAPSAKSLPPPPPRRREVTTRDIRQGSQLGKEHVRAVSMLHDSFARNLTHNLGAYLRGVFEVNLVSVEQLSYTEFLQRVPEVTYFASFNLMPADSVAAMQIDLPLAFPIIDLMLGGLGQVESEVREITEIEEQILESVVRIICRELQAAWQPLLDVEFNFDSRQQQAQILQLMPPNEKVLSLSFEIRMPEVRGMLNFAFPAVISNALLRRLSKQWSYRRKRTTSQAVAALSEQMLECPFQAQLQLPPTTVTVREMLLLRPGSVLMLKHRAQAPAVLMVAGKELFQAYPVRSGSSRGAQVERRLSIAGASRK
jgi:flagellar motor switch protein FliM